MGRIVAPQVFRKQPAESKIYTMDFTNLLPSGATISSVNSITATFLRGPTITGDEASNELPNLPASTKDDDTVSVRLRGGQDQQDWRLEFIVTDSAGNIHEGDGILLIRDD